MGKAIGGIKGALGLVKFIILYMHITSRSSMVCPPLCRPSRFLFEAAVRKQVPKRCRLRTPARGARKGFIKPGRSLGAHRAFVAAWVLAGWSAPKRLL